MIRQRQVIQVDPNIAIFSETTHITVFFAAITLVIVLVSMTSASRYVTSASSYPSRSKYRYI